MIIAVDIDNVLGQFIESFLEYCRNERGYTVKNSEIISNRLWSYLGKTESNQWELIFDYYESSYFDNIPVVSGSKEAIDALSKSHRLIAITGRPESTRAKTEKWLEKHFPGKIGQVLFVNSHYELGHTNRRHKSEYCKEHGAEMIIDDDALFANECASSDIKTIYFKTPFNGTDTLHPELIVAEGWSDVTKLVQDQSITK